MQSEMLAILLHCNTKMDKCNKKTMAFKYYKFKAGCL